MTGHLCDVRLSFAPHLRVWVRNNEEVFIRQGDEVQRAAGPLVAGVALLLDGRCSAGEIIDRLGREHNPLEVDFVLSRLKEQGLVVEMRESDRSPEAVNDSRNVTPEDPSHQLANPALTILAHGPVWSAALKAKVQALDLEVREAGKRLVILADDYRAPGLDAFIEEHRTYREAWLPASLSSGMVWLGPAFGPGTTSCWSCLAARLDAARPSALRPDSEGSAKLVFRESLPPPIGDAAVALLAREILGWCANETPFDFEATVIRIDPTTLRTERHPIVPRPGCRRCDLPLREWRPPFPQKTESLEEGPSLGLRIRSPENLSTAVRPLQGPIVGLVGDPTPHRGSFGGEINIAVASVRDARDLGPGRVGLRSRCGGTGRTVEAAQLAAVCEAIERASGLAWGNEPTIEATFAELGPDAIHPNACMLFSRDQYAAREAWNETEGFTNFVPQPFDEARRVEWSSLWSLRDSRRMYLPADLCYFGRPRNSEHDFCRADSNGCAAGSTLEEAVLHGFFELVERDAAALWWYNRSVLPAVDLETFDDPALSPVPDLCRHHGLECRVLDLTTDLEIPAFVALASRPGPGLDNPALGFGAHLCARTALRRALRELSLLLANRLSGSGEARFFTTPPEGPFLQADPQASLRRPEDFRPWPNHDVRGALEACVRKAAERGLNVLVLDQTRRGHGLSVARVVAPGLRPFWARFAPGRLYDVAVSIGRREHPNREVELNPSRLAL